ncbi:MAG: zinc-ribbon domain-containing protein [Eggerthellales bacterium]|nr:zinc-ribbon domain-containing protein [Eggerthellales bacterium]
MSSEEAKKTPVSEVPELMVAWADERDPSETMVWPVSWKGMCPGDGQYLFECSNGHHTYEFPYTYLNNGCPACRANATRGTGLFLADTSPELAAEWLQNRNGRWTPENVRQNSKREVWWKCLLCGNEWRDTPKGRSRRDGQCCPECGKIQGSIAWVYPEIASQWDSSNPVSPWKVRPNAKLSFTPLWVCSQNEKHKYRAAVPSRVHGADCPECVEAGKSRMEMRYFEAVQKMFGNARSGARYKSDFFTNDWSVDISVRYRGRKIAIEYDGGYWHKDKYDVDARKSLELISAGFIVVRIRENGLNSLPVHSPCYAEVYADPVKPDIPAVLDSVLTALDEMAVL